MLFAAGMTQRMGKRALTKEDQQRRDQRQNKYFGKSEAVVLGVGGIRQTNRHRACLLLLSVIISDGHSQAFHCAIARIIAEPITAGRTRGR